MPKTTISPGFAENLLRTFNDINDNPVHMLFNQFWADVPDEVAAAYNRQFVEDEKLAAFVADRYYADSLTVQRLADCPPGSFGEAVHDFIVDNHLEEKLATNYRGLHDMLARSGMLDRMPSALRYAVLRGFQLHDFLHVLVGYGPSARDEIALQAFCLAQVQFPYFAMWISVTTTRMAVIDPTWTVPLMDAIAEGWMFGRQARNIQFERWEDRIDEPLVDLRREFGIRTEGRGAFDPDAVLTAAPDSFPPWPTEPGLTLP